MELHIFTGKGGVGKTRCSLLYAQRKDSVQLSEKGFGLFEESKKLDRKIPQYREITSRDLLEEFLIKVIKVESLAKFASRSRLLQNLVQLAPNMDELLMLKKWTHLAEEKCLIIDGPSTGNMTAMFDAVGTAIRMFDGGVLRKIADELDSVFQSGEGIHLWIVSLPENSALEEMKEIENHFSRLYPQIKIHKVLNRKHKVAPEGLELSDRLHRLAYERPSREDQRLQGLKFDYWLYEGETSFVEKN